jgi:hypothetical protein
MASHISLERSPTFDEDAGRRAFRRERLCRLDGMLGAVEHTNARGEPVPETVIVGLGRFGVRVLGTVAGADVIEMIFRLQAPYLRAPITPVEQRHENALHALARERLRVRAVQERAPYLGEAGQRRLQATQTLTDELRTG